MGRRFKGYSYQPSFPQRLSPSVVLRITGGTPWLQVWMYQLTVTIVRLAKAAKMTPERVYHLQSGWDEPTPEELLAIAAALGTTVEEIEASRKDDPRRPSGDPA